MAKIIFALLGAALVLVGSFFLSLRLIDYFGLFHSGPIISLTADGEESLIISAGGAYNVTYKTSGAQSCEMVYRNAEDGSSGRYNVPPNTSNTGGSQLIGDYTLTCIGSDGATASKSVKISRKR